MNKNIKKICSIVLMLILIMTFSVNSFALSPNDIQADANKVVTGQKEIQNVGEAIVGILRTVGIVLSVVVLIVLGIKYMMGSAEEKSEYKKTMIPYLVGAALIFAASAFAEVIFQFFNGISIS